MQAASRVEAVTEKGRGGERVGFGEGVVRDGSRRRGGITRYYIICSVFELAPTCPKLFGGGGNREDIMCGSYLIFDGCNILVKYFYATCCFLHSVI